MKRLAIALLAVLGAHSAFAANLGNHATAVSEPQTYNTLPLRGVNLAGFEFGDGTMPPPEYFPTIEDANYFIEHGMNTIRVPVEWAYLQPSLTGPIGGNEYDTAVKNLIDTLTANKVTVILDLHDYMRYGGMMDGAPVIGAPGSPATVARLTALWTYLAAEYGNNPYVIFDLMNEPYADDNGYPTPKQVVGIYNKVIAGIRTEGANNKILLEGDEYSGLHSWEDTGNAAAFAEGKIIDPINDGKGNFAINVHQYFDGEEGYAGSDYGNCDHPDQYLESIHADYFAGWLRSNHYQAMITEFGGQAPNDETDPNGYCDQDMKHLLGFMQNNNDVFIGWTAWAGGHAWSMDGDSYTLDLQASGSDAVPQMQVLLQYLNPLATQEH